MVLWHISRYYTIGVIVQTHDDRVYREKMSDAKVQTANKNTWENEVRDGGKGSITS